MTLEELLSNYQYCFRCKLSLNFINNCTDIAGYSLTKCDKHRPLHVWEKA